MTAFLALTGTVAVPVARADGEPPPLEARLTCERPLVQLGEPIEIEFTLHNRSNEPLTLIMADLPVAEDEPQPVMGLPIEHVFSSPGGNSLELRSESDVQPSRCLSPALPAVGRAVRLAPRASVGTTLRLPEHCDALRRPGTYLLKWKPYRGTVESNVLRIVIAPPKQAVIHTDFGRMVMRFHYQAAPRHVENFLQLVEEGFYDTSKFHRVVHGSLIQGGCPRGDGTGIRPDGKLLKAEFNELPLDVGSVVMATRSGDPDSASCQFFICLSRLSGLDGKQTVFGQLVGDESFETLRIIGAVPIGDRDRPIKPVYIRDISLENTPPQERAKPGSGIVGDAGQNSTRAGTEAPVPLPAIGPASGVSPTTTRPVPAAATNAGGPAPGGTSSP
ncbi:MAG: peptidylprolyl isomerase [Phycisphaerae bacterium]|nr:peptidylprolyl isomerase [Phycisphaerae bacterium]